MKVAFFTRTALIASFFASIFGLSLLFGADSSAHNHHAHHSGAQKLTLSAEMMNLMHAPMMKEPFLQSDNVDLNFIANMIPHHQGAVDSAKFVLKHAKNQKVKKIAQDIIKAQEKEIKDFNAMLESLKAQKNIYSPKEVTLFNKDAKADMEAMHKAMSDVKLSNNIDKDFLAGMIPHHEGAVAASKQILQYSQNEQVKKIAQDIITAQEKEIKDFGVIIKNMK